MRDPIDRLLKRIANWFAGLSREQSAGWFLIFTALFLSLFLAVGQIYPKLPPYLYLIIFPLPMLCAVLSFMNFLSAEKKYGKFTGLSRAWPVIIASFLLLACVLFVIGEIPIIQKHYTIHDLELVAWSLVAIAACGLMTMFPLGRQRVAGNG